MKSAHTRLKKKPNEWLSGWVVEVHRHYTKTRATRSRTQTSLRLSSNRLCYETYLKKWWRKCIVVLLFCLMYVLFAILHPLVVR